MFGRAMAKRNCDIIAVRYYGGGDCLWLYMYLDCATWTMTCASDIGNYAYSFNNSQVYGYETFDEFCIRWLADSNWLLRKCVGEERSAEREFDYDATRQAITEDIKDWDDEERSEILDLLDDAERYRDDKDAFTVYLSTIAEERGVEMPDEWWCLIERDFTPWQKRFAMICADCIVPALQALQEKEAE